jgi:hypothetical protein
MEIRKIIREIAHKQMQVFENSKELSKMAIGFLKEELDKYGILNKKEGSWVLGKTFIVNENEFSKETNIGSINIKYDFGFSNEDYVSGGFSTSKTYLMENGRYFVEINLKVKIKNDFNDNIINKTESVLSHELHHAFVYLKKINKHSSSSRLNRVKNNIAKTYGHLIKNSLPLKEFVKMVYLSLPEEMSARVQETATNLKYIKSNDINEALEYLRKFQPINDAIQMRKYKFDVNNIDKIKLSKFVKLFNEELKNGSLKHLVKNGDGFFSFWENKINENGEKLFRKILRLCYEKIGLNEKENHFEKINESLTEVFWGNFFENI